MIRKVPNYNAWIGKVQEILNCYNAFYCPRGYLFTYSLPLFGLDHPAAYEEVSNDDLILVTDEYENKGFSLHFINEVNKI